MPLDKQSFYVFNKNHSFTSKNIICYRATARGFLISSLRPKGTVGLRSINSLTGRNGCVGTMFRSLSVGDRHTPYPLVAIYISRRVLITRGKGCGLLETTQMLVALLF